MNDQAYFVMNANQFNIILVFLIQHISHEGKNIFLFLPQEMRIEADPSDFRTS